MTKLTQSEIILAHLRDCKEWVYGYNLQKVATKYGWLGNCADRACRALAEEEKIERRHIGKYAEYRTKELQPKVIYTVPDRPGLQIKTY